MMNPKVKLFLGLALDILFPPDESLVSISDASAEDLASSLPKSQEIGSLNFALFAYSDERVKNLVWEIKYYKNLEITETVGKILAKKIENYFENTEQEILVIPVPQTDKRQKERGFNHTELIAKSVCKNLSKKFVLDSNLISKVRNTPKQSSLENRKERLDNLVGAFELKMHEQISGKEVVIIDDVITTGATVGEMRKLLVSAGINKVVAFAIAH